MSEITQIRRLAKRAVEDRDSIYAILDNGFVCHAAYLRDGLPVVIPTSMHEKGTVYCFMVPTPPVWPGP